MKSSKKIILSVSDKFHADIKAFAARKRTTIKDLIIELLVKHLIHHKQGQNE